MVNFCMTRSNARAYMLVIIITKRTEKVNKQKTKDLRTLLGHPTVVVLQAELR
jgi:hypothetical protein